VRARALPALPALLALALLGGCGESGNADSARKVLERAGHTPAESGDLKLELGAKLDGVEQLDGPLKLSLRGPFRSNGPRALPDLDWRMHAEASGKRVDLRVITVRDNAFVEYGGRTYEVGRELVRRYLRQSTGRQRDLRRLGVDASGWLRDPEVEDEGANRTVTGELDVGAMLTDVNRLIRGLPQGRPLPERTVARVEDAVKRADLEVVVGRDDVLRRSGFDVEFEVPEDLRARAKGLEGGDLRLRLEQSNVNGDQRIIEPTGARPLSELLGGFGLSPAVPG